MTYEEFEEKLLQGYNSNKLGVLYGVTGKRIRNVRAEKGIKGLYEMALKKRINLDEVSFEKLKPDPIKRARKNKTNPTKEKKPLFKLGDVVDLENSKKGIIDTIEKIGTSYVYVVINEIGIYQPIVESKLNKLQKKVDFNE